MFTFFTVCATLGGTILVLSLILSLLGLGLDAVGDFLHLGDLGGGHHSAGDLGGHDTVQTNHSAGHHGGTQHAQTSDSPSQDPHRAWNLGKYVTFQTVVAFAAFFGLAGMASMQSGKSESTALVVGMASGFAAMFLLGYAMSSFFALETDGTVHLAGSAGQVGRVYLRIPQENSGFGKVTLTVQDRTMEVRATTQGPSIETGQTVRVERVVDERTVEVSVVDVAAPIAASTLGETTAS